MIVGKHAFTALAALVLCTGVAAPALKAQVPAAPGEFPWDVVILNKTASGFSFRGNGVLISSNEVLTTAGNVDGANPSLVFVEAGTSYLGNGTIAPVSGFTVHDMFNVGPVPFANDIAVIHLAAPLPLGEFIQLATLATDDSKSYAGAMASVAGWWNSSCSGGISHSLLKANMEVISTAEANNLLVGVPVGIPQVWAEVWDSQLCVYDNSNQVILGGRARGLSINVGDGGLIKVAGLCSWGVEPSMLGGGLYDYAGCMNPSYPHVATRVSAYATWISDNSNGGGGGGQLLASPYTNLGNGTPGTGGETPMLVVSGYLTPGSTIQLDLSNAPAGALSRLFVGGSLFNHPFKGGVMVPGGPYLPFPTLPVGGDGTLSLGALWPDNVSAGAIYLQEWIVDAGGPKGFAATNGLEILTP